MQTLRSIALVAALTLGLSACTEQASAPAAEQVAPLTEGVWTLDPADSRLSYVSIKAGEIAEANRFDSLAGSVAADGTATLDIDLASVNTGIDIRNERMREIFFDVAGNPKAVVTAKLDPAAFAALAVGQSITRPLTASVAIKGVEQEIETEVLVTRVSADRVTVVPTAPVIISTDMFELTDELGELRALAQLPSITPAVPVTFTLSFTRS
ncbi:polyisoprenoid-binding protein YceI [Porphyrobacter sp. MBR-155]|jgi:polyisoprenoid-binding protein YceI|uniref:YceI family protein n=1 Tax=Porphyrobacter sp. MBR-155 TaxID=3156464 RepID=UPI003393F054